MPQPSPADRPKDTALRVLRLAFQAAFLGTAVVTGVRFASGADKEKRLFTVTFEPGKTSAQEILKALSTVAKDARPEGTAAATGKPAGHDCGKCPNAKTCDKHK